jgi:hypothetical protein
MKRNGSQVPTDLHAPLRITYHPNEEDGVIEDCLQNQFISHDLCDENHEREVETTVQALLASVDDIQSEKLDLVIYIN